MTGLGPSSTSYEVRNAEHAGSWYEGKGPTLSGQLDNWLKGASKSGASQNPLSHSYPQLPQSPTAPTSSAPSDPPFVTTKSRALIGPHAGYRYSGETAAYAYQYLATVEPRPTRVFVLGPSHHVALTGAALSGAQRIETPLGSMPVDRDVINTLMQIGASKKSQDQSNGEGDENSMDEDDDEPIFRFMTKAVDEAEHSLEMHYPYIYKVMTSKPNAPAFKIVPIMVGQVSGSIGSRLGTALSPYLDDPTNFFVISSDFCHWGSRFDYTYYNKSDGDIYQSIEVLDKAGMSAIVTHSAEDFKAYLKMTKNTICGRNPIICLLYAIASSKSKDLLQTTFVRYAQSSQCRDAKRDSSVSYASAVVHLLK